MVDIWKNDRNYYQEVIDFELCYCRDFGKRYQLEISAWTRKKISLYLWKNRREIVGSFCNIPKELFKKYEKMLYDECVVKGNEDFRNTYEWMLHDKAYKILEEKGEKIFNYKVNALIKELKEKELEEYESKNNI